MSFNAITDVAGVLVGHHQRIAEGWATGTTVVLLPPGSTGAVDGRGGAPGTRETDLLAPENLVQQVDAVCLSGGSAYGLAAADGVLRFLGERSLGFRVGEAEHEVVPIVPAAVIFDLPRSEWGNRPDTEFGYLACTLAADGKVAQGCVGAGTGAKVGSLKGGVGTASATVDGFTVGALAVVNAAGEAVNPATGLPWAADHEVAAEFGRARWPDRPGALPSPPRSDLNTTIGVVAVDADLTKTECRRIAVAAQDGLARAIRPAHSMFDGDTVFALATATTAAAVAETARERARLLDEVFEAGADCFSLASTRAVVDATS
ncbi:MAG TPA: P1 family peptidase, partial [Actinophytocola sp.]|nr:P1 family peptidase [Actinophytocola sp.]